MCTVTKSCICSVAYLVAVAFENFALNFAQITSVSQFNSTAHKFFFDSIAFYFNLQEFFFSSEFANICNVSVHIFT